MSKEEPYSVEKGTIGKVDTLTIYTLLDDYAGYETTFYGQHGISFLIARGASRFAPADSG